MSTEAKPIDPRAILNKSINALAVVHSRVPVSSVEDLMASMAIVHNDLVQAWRALEVATAPIAPAPEPTSSPVARLNVVSMRSGMRVIELSALAAAHELPEGLHELTAAVPFTKERILEIATTAALAVAKNARVAEQLCFPHIYLTLLEYLHAQPVAAPKPSSQTESPP